MGLCPCSTSQAAKASPYSLAVHCMRQAGRSLSRRRARPPALQGCVARLCFVGLYEAAFLGEVGSLGVVVVDSRFRSRWFDAPVPSSSQTK